jgi:hypothetical protein
VLAAFRCSVSGYRPYFRIARPRRYFVQAEDHRAANRLPWGAPRRELGCLMPAALSTLHKGAREAREATHATENRDRRGREQLAFAFVYMARGRGGGGGGLAGPLYPLQLAVQTAVVCSFVDVLLGSDIPGLRHHEPSQPFRAAAKPARRRVNDFSTDQFVSTTIPVRKLQCRTCVRINRVHAFWPFASRHFDQGAGRTYPRANDGFVHLPRSRACSRSCQISRADL